MSDVAIFEIRWKASIIANPRHRKRHIVSETVDKENKWERLGCGPLRRFGESSGSLELFKCLSSVTQ